MAVFILSAARSAVGNLGDGLKSLSSVDLASNVILAALERAGVPWDRVDELVLGCVLQAGAGPNLARQAALEAGLPAGVPAHTVNMAGASGLKAVALAAQALDAGGLAVAGGVESPSGAPFLLPAARWGARMGAAQLLDAVLQDGGEPLGLDLGIPREAQEAYAAESRRRAGAADFRREIVPLAVPGRKGELLIDADEALGAPAPPGFQAPLGDGAAMLVLAEERTGFQPRARILGYAQAAVDPTSGPGAVPAIQRLLLDTGLSFAAVDRWELDEADAALAIATLRALPELDPAGVNARGGSLALGHPFGATGARLLVTLLHLLEDEGLKTGVAAVSTSDGLGMAMAIERI